MASKQSHFEHMRMCMHFSTYDVYLWFICMYIYVYKYELRKYNHLQYWMHNYVTKGYEFCSIICYILQHIVQEVHWHMLQHAWCTLMTTTDQ